ncbi:MAG: ABC transporter substrate-binding protein [Gammaproteobacteria bacterium]|nr:ABC transporter substrate-binding protein [Gammaproteobacteria bacterium]
MTKFLRLSSAVAFLALMLMVFLVHSASAIDQRAPEQIVEETTTVVLAALNKEHARLKEDPTLINNLINETIIPIVDLNSMGKLILGKHWKRASEEQRSSFVSEFKDMLVRTYAKSLVDYGHAEVKVLPDRNSKESKYHTVKTELYIGSGKAPLQIAYIFRNNKQDEWKVFDLSVDGLSLVKNFRTSFSQEIKETSLDALIERLANTNKTGATDEMQTE